MLKECWNTLLPFISDRTRAAGLCPAHVFPSEFLQRQRQEGRELPQPGAGINRTGREEPNGGSKRKAHISSTSLEGIKQQHRRINANPNQPPGIPSSWRGWLCPSLHPWQLCCSSRHKHSLMSSWSTGNSSPERGNSKFISADSMFSWNYCTGNQTFCLIFNTNLCKAISKPFLSPQQQAKGPQCLVDKRMVAKN